MIHKVSKKNIIVKPSGFLIVIFGFYDYRLLIIKSSIGKIKFANFIDGKGALKDGPLFLKKNWSKDGKGG